MTRSLVDDAAAHAVASRYPFAAGSLQIRRFGSGLINDTFEVIAPSGAFVLQRLHPVFDPRIHENIEAVTAHLQAHGMITPRLVHDRDGELFTRDAEGTPWRMMTKIPGCTFDRLRSPAQARSAGALLGRFHRVLSDLDHEFVGLRVGIHDTPGHLQRLRAALGAHPEHRLAAQVRPLAEALFEAAERLPSVRGCPARVVHGDPKLNNVLFAGEHAPLCDETVCWVDLDTVAPMALAWELGDAWRSWCNPRGEDSMATIFDVPAFEASWRGYAGETAGFVTAEERSSLVHGVEWITLELACRFLTDALEERYFGWSSDRHATAGDHNLARARGQWSLHAAVMACRAERERVLLSR